MAKRQPLPSPAHPPHGPQHMGTPLVALEHVTHRPTARPPPAYHPPPPLPDKVAHKPPKRPRPPPPAAHAKARKHARQPQRPVRPLSLKRNSASQPQPEPPPPKRPLTIWDMFNLPPPPPRPAPPLAASAPVSAPSPRITKYFAPASPPPAGTNSHSSSSSSNVSSLWKSHTYTFLSRQPSTALTRRNQSVLPHWHTPVTSANESLPQATPRAQAVML